MVKPPILQTSRAKKPETTFVLLMDPDNTKGFFIETLFELKAIQILQIITYFAIL